MEYIEIILEDVQPKYFPEILGGRLQFHASDIISSHFFDSRRGVTLEYTDIADWDALFRAGGTGDIFLSKINIGMELRQAVVLISCRSPRGDITINVDETQFRASDMRSAEKNYKELFLSLDKLGKDCEISHIVIGYEPAEDRDMRIIELCHGQVDVFDENNFRAPEIQTLRRVGKQCWEGAV